MEVTGSIRTSGASSPW